MTRPSSRPGYASSTQLEGTPAQAEAKTPVAPALRILAAFSLPERANPLNLRRERYGLQRLVRDLTRTQGLAVDLRILQYGATRDTLRDALEEAEGWDVVHLSGHGDRGELLLEDDRGGSDPIDASELGDLLDLARARLKLLILDACYTGAGGHAAARAQVGLALGSVRQEGAEGAAVDEAAATVLPSLALALSQKLDCAALAMRYPVGDAFATDLLLALYEKLLDRRRPLPAALHLALDETLANNTAMSPLSPVTPILVGPRAADLQLVPPQRPPQGFALPEVGLSLAFHPSLCASWAACSLCCAPAKPWPRAVHGAVCCSTACPVGARPPAPWSWLTATSTAASKATSGTRRLRCAATSPPPCST